MKLAEQGREMKYLDIDSDRVPCAFLVKLTDRTYRMAFRYNEVGDFFTVDISTTGSDTNTVLVTGEILRLDKPLFEAYNDDRYPLPLLVPMCLTGDDIDAISWDNFGSKVKIYLVDRPGGDD